MHPYLWQSRLSATSDKKTIAKHKHTRKLAARAHIYTYALEQIGEPYLGLGGDMHKDVCILSVRVVQQGHGANTARAVYKQNTNSCSNWGQRAPIVRSRHPLHYPAHIFVFTTRPSGL